MTMPPVFMGFPVRNYHTGKGQIHLKERKEEKKMQIFEYRVALASDRRNILVREKEQDYGGMEKITSPDDAARVMREVFRLHERAEEYVYLACLDIKGHPIGFFEVSHGSCRGAMAGSREILVRALLCGASGIILAHNHPSGDPSPSKEDGERTGQIRRAAELVGIDLIDHVIIAGFSFYSYMEASAAG